MIDTQTIRSKILDLAMRGKLTEQLPEDGTAEVLVATSTNMKTTRMVATPFEIPNNWRWTLIEKLTTPVGKKINQIYANEVKNTGKYPAISQGEQFIDGYTDEEKAIVDLPVIIFGDHTKNVKFVDFPFVICADGTKCLNVSSPNNPKYVFYWMKYASCAIEDRGYARHYPLLKKYPVSLPPLMEQNRIVERIEQAFSVLDTIDALQAQYTDNLAVLKSKLIDAAIQGKLTEQLPEDGTAEELYQQIQAEKQSLIKAGKIKKEKPLPPITADEIPFEIPAIWKWCRLQSVFNFIDYRGVTPYKITEGVPFITAKNVRQGYIDHSISEFISEADYQKRQSRGISHKGDILFTTEAPMGYAAIADLDRFSAGQRLITLQQYTVDHLLDNKYYMYAISAPFFQKQLDGKCSGTTVKGIKADRLKQFLIPLPTLAEQKRIVAKLDEVLEMIGQTPPRALREEN